MSKRHSNRLIAAAETMEILTPTGPIAEAARTYARAAKLGLEAQNLATEIKLRAERKAGELLGELERKPGERVDKLPDKMSAGSEYRQAIEAVEVEERTAQRWQEVAKIPEPIFEEHIAFLKESREELSTAGLHHL